MNWIQVYDDLEFKECEEFSDIKKTGFYIIEFIALGWEEPDTEEGYGCGDADLEIISIESTEYKK